MDSKLKDEKVSVYLKVKGDTSCQEYGRCIKILNKHSVQTATDPPGGVSEIFESKDRLIHSPLTQKRQSSSFAHRPSQPKEPSVYSFDWIFCENDPPSLFVNDLSLHRHNCIVSIGSSESLIEIIHSTLTKAISEGFCVKGKHEDIQNDQAKLENWSSFQSSESDEGQQNYENISSVPEIRQITDKIIPKKVNIVTVLIEKELEKYYLQFADIPYLCPSLELLQKLICNESLKITNDRVINCLANSISFGGFVTVIGNVQSIDPHKNTTLSVLNYLNSIYSNKHKTNSFYTNLLINKINRLQMINYKQELENSTLKQKIGCLELDNLNRTERTKIVFSDKNTQTQKDIDYFKILRNTWESMYIMEKDFSSHFITQKNKIEERSKNIKKLVKWYNLRVQMKDQECNDFKSLLECKKNEVVKANDKIKRLEDELKESLELFRKREEEIKSFKAEAKEKLHEKDRRIDELRQTKNTKTEKPDKTEIDNLKKKHAKEIKKINKDKENLLDNFEKEKRGLEEEIRALKDLRATSVRR